MTGVQTCALPILLEKKLLTILRVDMEIQYIEKIVEENRKHFVNTWSQNVQLHGNFGMVAILMDSSHRLIGIAHNYITVESLLNHKTAERSSFACRNAQENMFVNSDFMWTVKYNKVKETWEQDLNFKDDSEVNYFILMNEKLKTIDAVNDILCIQKARLVYKLPYEQNILIGKLYEVDKIISNNVQTDELNEYPIVSAYAKFRNITISEAANEIQFKLKHDFSYLGELEYNRLKYTDMIVKTSEIKDLKEIISDLHNVTYGYSRFGIV